MDIDEKKLLEEVAAGDHAAWRKFVVKYSPIIYSTIKRTFLQCRWKRNQYYEKRKYNKKLKGLLRPDPPLIKYEQKQKYGPDEDDVCQEVFMLLCKDNYARLKSFEGTCKPSTWLYKIAKNATFNFINKESIKYKGGASSIDEPLRIEDDIAVTLNDTIQDETYDKKILLDKMITEENINWVLKNIERLKRSEQHLLLLHLKEISPDQIARMMGRTKAAIHMQMKRIEKRLLIMYRKEFGHER